MADMVPCKHGVYKAYEPCRECDELAKARARLTPTHYGWFMFCPVLLGCLDTEAPLVVPRWPVLTPLFWIAEGVQSAVIAACSLCIPGYEPRWYFAVGRPIHEGKS